MVWPKAYPKILNNLKIFLFRITLTNKFSRVSNHRKFFKVTNTIRNFETCWNKSSSSALSSKNVDYHQSQEQSYSNLIRSRSKEWSMSTCLSFVLFSFSLCSASFASFHCSTNPKYYRLLLSFISSLPTLFSILFYSTIALKFLVFFISFGFKVSPQFHITKLKT